MQIGINENVVTLGIVRTHFELLSSLASFSSHTHSADRSEVAELSELIERDQEPHFLSFF